MKIFHLVSEVERGSLEQGRNIARALQRHATKPLALAVSSMFCLSLEIGWKLTFDKIKQVSNVCGASLAKVVMHGYPIRLSSYVIVMAQCISIS